jgi:hypothetical protein
LWPQLLIRQGRPAQKTAFGAEALGESNATPASTIFVGAYH